MRAVSACVRTVHVRSSPAAIRDVPQPGRQTTEDRTRDLGSNNDTDNLTFGFCNDDDDVSTTATMMRRRRFQRWRRRRRHFNDGDDDVSTTATMMRRRHRQLDLCKNVEHRQRQRHRQGRSAQRHQRPRRQATSLATPHVKKSLMKRNLSFFQGGRRITKQLSHWRLATT